MVTVFKILEYMSAWYLKSSRNGVHWPDFIRYQLQFLTHNWSLAESRTKQKKSSFVSFKLWKSHNQSDCAKEGSREGDSNGGGSSPHNMKLTTLDEEFTANENDLECRGAPPPPDMVPWIPPQITRLTVFTILSIWLPISNYLNALVNLPKGYIHVEPPFC